MLAGLPGLYCAGQRCKCAAGSVLPSPVTVSFLQPPQFPFSQPLTTRVGEPVYVLFDPQSRVSARMQPRKISVREMPVVLVDSELG